MINCAQCQVNTKNKKFCSRQCKGIYVNAHRDKQASMIKQKASYDRNRLNHKPHIKHPKKYCLVSFWKCMECNRFYYIRNRSQQTIKTCRQCIEQGGDELRLKRIRKAASISAQKLSRRSKDEIKLYELCKSTYESTLPNKIIIDTWDTDIFIPEYKLCIFWNGPWHYTQLPLSNHSLSQVQNRDRLKTKLFKELGMNILVFEDRDYTPIQAFKEIQNWIGASN